MPSPISCTRFVAYVGVVETCATPYRIPSVPKIVANANANGIAIAHEMPSTATSTMNAIGSAIASPLKRSRWKIGSRSCWIAGAPVT